MKLNVFKRQTPPPPAPPDRKASVTGAILAMGGQAPVAWSPRDTPSLIRNGFAGNPVGDWRYTLHLGQTEEAEQLYPRPAHVEFPRLDRQLG